MTNRRFETLGIQPFRTRPLLAEGLLAVAREGGDLERRTAQGLFALAGYFGDKADAEAEKRAFADADARMKAGDSGARLTPDYGIDPALATAGAAADGPMAAVLRKAAAKYGQDGDALVAIAKIESEMNPNAKNPNSSAGGLLQFVDQTAKAYGLANRYDPVQAADAGARLLRDNREHLRRALGREPTAGELYLAHQQGAGGAAKLLTSPNRRASDLVGYEAVRLNGGNATMTAGEFAAKWTGRVKPGRPAPAGEAPAAQPGQTAINLPDVRPTGKDTVYGRAYDKQLVRGYLSRLDAEVARTTSQIYRQNRDDPQKMADAFESLRREFLKNHVFPQIGSDFEEAFTRKTGAYLDDAYRLADARRIDAEKADFVERTGALESGQQQALAALDPGSAVTADEISAQQQTIDAHYDEAVKRGLVTAEEAANRKIESRRTAALGFYKKQAEALDADGLAALRKTMEADYADGGIDGLDGQGWQTLNDGLRAMEKTKRIEADQSMADLVQRGDVFAARIVSGMEINKDEWSKFTLDAAAGGKDIAGEADAKIAAARAIRDLPLDAAAKRIAELRTSYGDAPNDSQIRTLAFAEKALADKAKALRTDPLTHAESMGLTAPSGNLADAALQGGDAVSAVLMARERAAQKIEAEYGVPARLLKPGEAKALADMARRDPAAGAQIAGAIVEGAGPRALATLAELGDTAPVMAGAGLIIANGGNPAAAEDALRGQSKDIKVKIKPAAAAAEWHATAGKALDMQPVDAKRIMATAQSIARARIDDASVEPDSEEAGQIYREAMNEAAGGQTVNGVQFGGFATIDLGGGWFDGRTARQVQVLVPPSIRADRLPALLAAVTDADLYVKPKGGAAQLAALAPVAVQGGFAFSNGDPDNPAWLQADNGNLFIMDLEAMRKVLSPRVPGAFK